MIVIMPRSEVGFDPKSLRRIKLTVSKTNSQFSIIEYGELALGYSSSDNPTAIPDSGHKSAIHLMFTFWSHKFNQH